VKTALFTGILIMSLMAGANPGLAQGKSVPEVLLSGDHAAIEKWRREQAEVQTRQRRPDLLE